MICPFSKLMWTARRSNQSILKEISPWDFFGRNDAKAETLVLWPPHEKSWLIGKDSDARRDWGAGGEGDDRGWDGWMASLTRWTWVWVNSGSWWWTGRPGVLRFMGSQRVGHDWATDLIWSDLTDDITALSIDTTAMYAGSCSHTPSTLGTHSVNRYWWTVRNYLCQPLF